MTRSIHSVDVRKSAQYQQSDYKVSIHALDAPDIYLHIYVYFRNNAEH